MGKLIFAFDPPDEPLSIENAGWPECPVTLYKKEVGEGENPYDVEISDDEIIKALTNLPKSLHEYKVEEGEWWVRYDYESLINGEPERIT